MIEAIALSKSYGAKSVVNDLSFTVSPGQVTGFLGPNGAGKTTTLRLLLGFAEPSSGQALVFGRPYRELDHPARRVGAVLESNDFHPGRTGRDHLRALAIAGEFPVSRVDEVLEMVELTASCNERVKTYSLGMQQRLGLAAALLGDPELLVLDEPANGLDLAGLNWLRSVLRGFADGGRAVLVSSHMLAELAKAVDQVLVINHGRLVAAAQLNELTTDGQTLEEVYLELTSRRAS